MDFELSEELKMIRSLARDFVADQLKPLERDLLGRSADLSDARACLDSETELRLKEKAEEAGLWGASVPEEFGGVGLDTMSLCIIEEELAQTVVPFRFGDVTPLLFECSQDQRLRYLGPALNHHKTPLIALVEPAGAEALPSMAALAEPVPGGFSINGSKLSIGRLDSSYFAIVFAVTRKGPTCFLVDKGNPGLKIIDNQDVAGWKSAARRPHLLRFDSCVVPAENVLGPEGEAFSLGKRWLPSRRIVRAARSVGVCQRLLDEALVRAQTWETFGSALAARAPVQVILAEAAAMVRAFRLTVYESAWKTDRGTLVKVDSSMLKLLASRTVSAVSDKAAQVFGGPPAVAAGLWRRSSAITGDLSIEVQSSIVVRELLKSSRT